MDEYNNDEYNNDEYNNDEYNNDEYNNDDYNKTSYQCNESIITDDSTVFTEIKVKKNGKFVSADPGHKRIGTKKNKLEYFATSLIPGNTIRNAVTGIPEYNKVGSAMSEDQYFKVRYAGNDSGNSPDTLYYDSPEQFERHMNCRLKTDAKQIWKNKYNRTIMNNSE
tara:strand:+ start:722 stop:1219 length:498 start_codon:yes stop_codon:yes gene_type:complete